MLLDELQISSSNIGAQGGGVDTLKHLLGLSPDLPATIKCRYNDVKVPAETFRIITVQDLAKLHHNLDDTAKVRPPDLMLEGFEWRARPLDKVFDADTRAVLKRCILVEVTAQCVKDSVREKRVRQGDLHGGEFEGLVQRPVIRDTGACLLRAQTRQKPDRTRTDRCKPPALARCTLAGLVRPPCPKTHSWATRCNTTRFTLPQLHAVCAVCAIMLYVLYVLYGIEACVLYT